LSATAPEVGPSFDVRPLSPAERAFDLAVALLVMPFVLVIGSLIATAVFVDSPGPVFYRSRRVGQGGREFDMLKFRKMRRSATGAPLTLEDDERFTPIGKFLALTKLDEMPQLWNVLKGDMRLVGPRPEVAGFVEAYPDAYETILRAVPGITGPAAVAFANESSLLTGREDATAYYRAELLPLKIDIDIDYVCNRSIAGDLKLLARTTTTPLHRVLLWVRRRTGGTAPRMMYRELVYYCGGGGALLLTFALSIGLV
jgi:lipopolysaccharide/colanic/teichoic acid biosynthesis glycosyltransferase